MIDELLKFWPIVLVALNVIVLWAQWTFKRAVPSHEDVAAVNARINNVEDIIVARLSEHDQRLTRMEERAKHAPTHEDLTRLHVRMDAMSKELSTLVGESRSASRTLDLIHDYLLNGGKQ